MCHVWNVLRIYYQCRKQFYESADVIIIYVVTRWRMIGRNNILTCRDNDIASGLKMVFNIDSNAIMNIKEK
jgi:hypothetical protein